MDEEKGLTQIYCGPGKGKTSVAIGQAIRAIGHGKRAIVIQFLKGRERRELDFLEELDNMDIKIFRFERMDRCYEDLSVEEKKEERLNILNGLNFARKVIATQECDFLLLDEILRLLDNGITTEETIGEILKLKDESMHIVMTGQELPEGLRKYVDRVTTLSTENISNDECSTEE